MLLRTQLSIGTITPSVYASFCLISPDYAMSFAKCYFFDFDLESMRRRKGIKELRLSQSQIACILTPHKYPGIHVDGNICVVSSENELEVSIVYAKLGNLDFNW